MKTKSRGWPVTVKRGNVAVKIYETVNRDRILYTVAFRHIDGSRKRLNFSDPRKARIEAERIATQLHNGEFGLLELSHIDAAIYARALEIPPNGQTLDAAAAEYAEARRILGDLGSLKEAAKFYIKHHATACPGKVVSEILMEFLQSKTRDGYSNRYIEDCRSRLTCFSEAFPHVIADVSCNEMQAWLEYLSVGPRSRNNLRNLIITFFNFSRDRGYLPKTERTEAEGLTRAKEIEAEIGILTPKQLGALLKNAPADLVPYITISAFAGLRRAEVMRLDWSEVDTNQNLIRVTSEKAKTGQRRIVPIQPNLAKWLESHVLERGSICRSCKIPERVTALADTLKIEWPNNALRHSYASYRLAQCQDTAKVALEMGNSPSIIFRHYRQLVTPAEAEKWWKIQPLKEE